MLRLVLALLLAFASALPSAAQTTAINGTIEGTVTDDQGAVLPGVVVTVRNVETGDTRSVITNESGVYRALLLPLGDYRVAAELQGFKKYEQSGISLRAGQIAVVDVKLSVGAVTETVSVTADSPLVDLGKIEQGRTLTSAEIKTLPLTSRNPYNFALLQPGVVGFETQEFGVPRLTANGALLRVNYQIDGNDNTAEGSRRPAADADVRGDDPRGQGRHHRLRARVRSDDGAGLQRDHPVGHQSTCHGQASYRFQRKPMVELPFFATDRVKPPTKVNIFTADNGGPIIKNKTHSTSADSSTPSATCRARAS